MNKKLLALLLLAGGSVFGQLTVTIGPPPPPRVVRVRPVRPSPDYVWVEGYWYPSGRHYRWHDGYWTRAPYSGAYWVGPRYESNRFYEGQWEGSRGPVVHNHRWDRDRDRDYRYYREERREHGH